MRTSLVALVALAGAAFPAARAQCRPGPNSNEAKLLAFYSVPIAFSALDAPRRTSPWHVELQGELSPVPFADPAIEHASECYTASAQQHSRLTRFFARPRVLVTLPLGLAVEASYIPPIQIGDAHPHLGSAALSETAPLSGFGPFGSSALMIRAHGTIGHVRGPITCSQSSLQQTDPEGACYGSRPSNDTFNPTMFGLEGVYGVTSRGGRLELFAGSGVTWLRPRFEVGFTDLNGVTDNTRIEVNLERWSLLGGATLRLPAAFALTAEVYSVPKDVTTWRLAASYRLP
ncbi:MAG: hypothetical protein JJD97_02045 [Gemmatimonadaceae bacterium]|nr:hypothetical protein [Gemmatimonadaceae bacterium]